MDNKDNTPNKWKDYLKKHKKKRGEKDYDDAREEASKGFKDRLGGLRNWFSSGKKDK